MQNRDRFTAEERQAIVDGFDRLLADMHREVDVRRIMADPDGHDPAIWRAMADMGLTGLLIDPDYGGAGGSAIEIELLMERAGASLLAGPFFASAVMAAALLSASDDPDTKRRLLPPIASGETIATVALIGDDGFGPGLNGDATVTARATGGGWALDGTASYVICAHLADTLLVVARHDTGIGAFEVDPAAAGVRIEALRTWDQTLRLSRISFDGVGGRQITGCEAAAIGRMLDLARVALAGEQAGGARHVFDMTVDYIRTRIQFGRPVGGFQALKHMAADLLLEVESATSIARHAARSLANSAADAALETALACFTCAEAFEKVAADAIQMHGGIAFTWDHPAHLYLRRARADAQLFGTPESHRERFVALLEKLP